MKKGILTTLLLASGAALAVYLLKEEQEKKIEIDEEKRMIKIRSDEEDQELVRTIQEIESLPVRQLEAESVEDSVDRSFLNDFQEVSNSSQEPGEHEFENHTEKLTMPSFVEPFVTLSDTDFDDLLNALPEDDFASSSEEDILVEDLEDNKNMGTEESKMDNIGDGIVIPSFVGTTPVLNDIDFNEKQETFPGEIEELVGNENNQTETLENNENKVTEEGVNDSAEDGIVIPSFVDTTEALNEIDFEELLRTLPNNEMKSSFNEIQDETSDNNTISDFTEVDSQDTMEDSLKYMFEKQYPNASDETFEELTIPSFESIVSPAKLEEEVLNPIFGENDVEVVVPSVDTKKAIPDFFEKTEIPTMMMPKLDEDDMSKTAVFNLPKSFRSENTDSSVGSGLKAPINPFDDDLEEIDLSELFAKMDDEDAVDLSSLFEETSEMKLVDIDEDEIKKLFTMDDQDDLEEIRLNDVEDIAQAQDIEIKMELTEEEFEDFRKRLVHIGEDDIDLINFKDSKPFETTNHLNDEIDIINFGNIVEEPTIALEDLVLDKPIELLAQETQADDELAFEETSDSTETEQLVSSEFPSAIYDIHKLYPYLNLKFINAVFNNFGDFIQEFEVGSSCKITHRVQFPDAKKLISFIEVTKEYGYEIAGTDEDHNILLTLEFINEESKILSEIYNISNQVNCLDGLYRGYELEHI